MKRSPAASFLFCGLAVAIVAGAAAPALAQSSPPPAVAVSAGGSGSGAGIGVGASAFLSGLTGAQVVYDMPRWQIEGLLAFNSQRGNNPNSNRVTDFDVGVSAWYHLHQGASSDFSVGGGVGLVTSSGGGNSATAEVIEPGVQARVFVTSNVAVHGRLALPLQFGDSVGPLTGNSRVGLGGQILFGFGFTYFFR
jgi:hypothetical protein